jgi:hypothetical protein
MNRTLVDSAEINPFGNLELLQRFRSGLEFARLPLGNQRICVCTKMLFASSLCLANDEPFEVHAVRQVAGSLEQTIQISDRR